MTVDAIEVVTNLEQNLTLASLAKSETALMTAEVFADLTQEQCGWAQEFTHPILEDLAPQQMFYSIERLPEREKTLITGQAQVVVGFNLAT